MNADDVKIKTTEYLHAMGVTVADLSYITDTWVRRAPMPLSVQALKESFADAPAGSPPARTEGSSAYIFAVTDLGDRISFYTSCGQPQGPYYVDKSDIASLEQTGVCGNYALFYMVLN